MNDGSISVFGEAKEEASIKHFLDSIDENELYKVIDWINGKLGNDDNIYFDVKGTMWESMETLSKKELLKIKETIKEYLKKQANDTTKNDIIKTIS